MNYLLILFTFTGMILGHFSYILATHREMSYNIEMPIYWAMAFATLMIANAVSEYLTALAA